MPQLSMPRTVADRLSRLSLACADEAGPLGQIGIRITPTFMRCAATNGRILASLIVPIEYSGEPLDVILDADQFTAAMKASAKTGTGRITVDIGPTEARFTCGAAAAIVRRIQGAFPTFGHIWTRPAGRRWIPAVSSLDPGLVAIAQKISGHRTPLLFSSPVDPAVHLERCWAVPGASPDDTVSLVHLRAAIIAPAYWADHELAVLIMPITRSDGERQLDLSQHALAMTQAAVAA